MAQGMERVTVTLDADLLVELDRYAAARGYAGRSEAVRDMLREGLSRGNEASEQTAQCVATLTYVYEHDKRQLAKRIVDVQHDAHDVMVTTLHVHLDHDNCLEVAVMRGDRNVVRAVADGVMAERGVRHGHLHMVPASISGAKHPHGPEGGHSHPHTHVRPVL
jgi:CopG family transcriptional regulator, nickel-responsive regulator